MHRRRTTTAVEGPPGPFLRCPVELSRRCHQCRNNSKSMPLLDSDQPVVVAGLASSRQGIRPIKPPFNSGSNERLATWLTSWRIPS